MGHTVLGKSLDDGTDNHDPGAEHDGPSPAVALGKPWCNGHGKDGSELVARVDKAEQTGLDGKLASLGIPASATKVCNLAVSNRLCLAPVEEKWSLYTHGMLGRTAAC